MGDPKYPRRVWKKPKRPLNYDLKMEELETLGKFGLRTKRELWKARTELSRVRHQARSLLALGKDARREKEPVLLNSLSRIGLVGGDSTLDDILSLQVTDLLSRRLQTVVMKKFGFRTPYQARQAVVHGHVVIGERVVNVPSYVVPLEEEKSISLRPGSGLAKAVRDKKDGGAKGKPGSGAEPPQPEAAQGEPTEDSKPDPEPAQDAKSGQDEPAEGSAKTDPEPTRETESGQGEPAADSATPSDAPDSAKA